MLHKVAHRLAICALLVLALTKCTPLPVYRLHPINNNLPSRWIRGHEILRIDGSKYDAAVAFEKQVDKMLAFDVQIINTSDSMISVAPNSIYAITYKKGTQRSQPRPEKPQILRRETFAYNPEQELIHVDQSKHVEDASYKTDRIIGPIYSLIDAVFDAAISNKQNNYNRSDENNIEYNTYITRRTLEHSEEIKSLDAQHFQWSTEALRRTDLLPNESVRGLVFIAADPKADILELHLNVAGENHLIYFRQEKYK
jgi:hypothetical protein